MLNYSYHWLQSSQYDRCWCRGEWPKDGNEYLTFVSLFLYNTYTVEPPYHHYDDVTMSLMASQITSLTIVYSTVYSQIKENIKAPRHWSLCGEFTGDRWIPRHLHGWAIPAESQSLDIDIAMHFYSASYTLLKIFKGTGVDFFHPTFAKSMKLNLCTQRRKTITVPLNISSSWYWAPCTAECLSCASSLIIHSDLLINANVNWHLYRPSLASKWMNGWMDRL